ncbi:MAG TPA: ABC transporter permease, partial [Lacipirellulaceae bacterium]|nr:ABC transporter permease [Lacipirellulaceae bacterium]
MSSDVAVSAVSDDQPSVDMRGAHRATGGRAASAWSHIERVLVYAGDWLNPILVKETRQALKSFQFTVTFILLLIGCWIVTMGGVALIGPRIFYAAEGGSLMLWYYAILAFPLAVVVPYAAFRSLAEEREDNTYDLLSITTLRPRQIISGKLGSALVQMGVYFSAITPCLAFTYLLRGIDLPTIAVLLAYLFFWSLGLSMIGILLATLTKRRFAHVFVSVAFVGTLLW